MVVFTGISWCFMQGCELNSHPKLSNPHSHILKPFALCVVLYSFEVQAQAVRCYAVVLCRFGHGWEHLPIVYAPDASFGGVALGAFNWCALRVCDVLVGLATNCMVPPFEVRRKM